MAGRGFKAEVEPIQNDKLRFLAAALREFGIRYYEKFLEMTGAAAKNSNKSESIAINEMECL